MSSPVLRALRNLPARPDSGEMEYTEEDLPLADLKIDREYQRPLTRSKVSQIATRFEGAAAGHLVVSRRLHADYITDGQHRWEAMKQIGLLIWRCNVYRDLQQSDEARIFVECNLQRATPSAVHVLRARSVAGDPVAKALYRITQQYGFVISEHRRMPNQQGGARVLFAVSAAERIYNDSGEAGLRWTLETIKRLWSLDDVKALDAVVIRALGHIRRRYGETLPGDFVEKMESRTLGALLRRGRELADLHRGSYDLNTARAMIELYNSGKRSQANMLHDYLGGVPGTRREDNPWLGAEAPNADH